MRIRCVISDTVTSRLQNINETTTDLLSEHTTVRNPATNYIVAIERLRH